MAITDVHLVLGPALSADSKPPHIDEPQAAANRLESGIAHGH